MDGQWTVGSYLARRIAQAGAGHVFGVPGDFVLSLFDEIVRSELDLVVTCNELNAGYAADAYARLHGIGAVAVTYDVGGFSLLNAVAGAHAERVPLIVVSGAPPTTTVSNRHILHHSTGDLDAQYTIYRTVTEAAVQLTDAASAPALIDSAIATCLRVRRPCYIEVPLDIVDAPCRAPEAFTPPTRGDVDADALRESVAEAAGLIRAAAAMASDGGPQVSVIAGIEAHRLGLAAELQTLIEHLASPFVTTISSKSVLPETHPQFAGVYVGHLGRPGPQEVVERAEVLLSLGAIMSDLDLGLYTADIDEDRLVVVNSDRVRIGHHTFEQVPLGDFMRALSAAVPARAGGPDGQAPARPAAAPGVWVPEEGRPITVERFYQRMHSFLEPGCLVLADAGDAMFSASDLPMPAGATFLAQGFYASIGWTVPATLGALCAEPGRPTVTFVGDGAFQMTAQELSTIAKRGQAPVMFVADNGGYVIERLIHDGPYNDVHPWDYARFAAVVGGPPGIVVETEGDLERALASVSARSGELCLVQVKLGPDDASEILRRFGAADQ